MFYPRLHAALLGTECLHDWGIIHRDMKPSNILHNSCGLVKLSDYDLAKHLVGDACATQVGTLAYMAPERIQGEPHGSAADVWSLGLVFYELAVGRSPFTGVSMIDLWQQVCEDDIAPLQACLPQGLVHLVHSGCLRKDLAERLDATSLLALEVLREPAKASCSDLADWRMGAMEHKSAIKWSRVHPAARWSHDLCWMPTL